MRQLIISIALFLVSLQPAISQRTAYEIGVSKTFFKKLEIGVTPQIRLRENFTLKEYFADASVDYELFEFLTLGASYRLGTNITEKKKKKENFGRFAFDMKSGFRFWDFEPSLRLRFTNNDDFSYEIPDNTNYFRYKFELAYDIPKLPLKPYLYAEAFQNMTLKDFDKRRFEGGLSYKISKKHRIGCYFRNNNNWNGGDPVNYLGVFYKLKL
jgi:hypothetical protein